MKENLIQRELFATLDDEPKAQQIVTEELGMGFYADYHSLPKNVGVLGDEGVRGHTVLIYSDLGDPAKFMAENYELLGRVANRICNEMSAACRVLFDFTGAGPFFGAE